MSRDEIKETLSKANNSIELIGLAAKLKSSGEDEIMVNRVVSEVRKEMLNRVQAVKPLPKNIIPDIDTTMKCFMSIRTDFLSKAMVVYDGNTVII